MKPEISEEERKKAIAERNAYLATAPDFEKMFAWCEKYGSADDWNELAIRYYSKGYDLNALYCFRKADEMAVPLTVYTDAVRLKVVNPASVGR